MASKSNPLEKRIFLFAIWDNYRTTVDLNNLYLLASKEDASTNTYKMGAIEINYLDKKASWSFAILSFIIPGVGQLSMGT